MKVIFVSEPLFPLSGTSSRTITLAKSLVIRGHEVNIITPREVTYPNRSIKDVKIIRLKALMYQSFGKERMANFFMFLLKGGLFQIMSELIKLYNSKEPTIVHYVNYYMSICGLFIERFLKIKSIHDFQASAYLESTNKLDGIMKLCLEKICSNSQNLMFITDELHDYFIERYLLFNKHKYVIPLSTEIKYFKNNDIRRKLVSRGCLRYLIVYHGSPYPENIEALKKVKTIVKRLNQKGLNCKVLVLGFVGHYVSSPDFFTFGYVDDLDSYISVADLAILPLDRGSLGMRTRIMDYMSCGVPVIALSSGLSGYHVALKKKALIVSRNIDEIIIQAEKILLDSSLQHEIRRNAIQCLEEHFSHKIIGSRLESIYEEVMKY